MLPKKNRLDKKKVERIFKEGRVVNSLNISLKFSVVKDTPLSSVSFVTPKTINKSAVVRNQLRRRGYAVLKKYFNILPAGFLGVFIFGKKSVMVFGGRKNSKYNPIVNLDNEIKLILSKI